MYILSLIKNKFWNNKYCKSNGEERSQMLRNRYGIKIGNNCDIFHSTSFSTEPYMITIGNNVKTSSNVRFATHDGAIGMATFIFERRIDGDLLGAINVGNNVFLGIDVIVLPNTIIGGNVIVAAGAVVKGIIPSNVVVGGVPAKTICSIENYYNKNKSKIKYTGFLSFNEKRNIWQNKGD